VTQDLAHLPGADQFYVRRGFILSPPCILLTFIPARRRLRNPEGLLAGWLRYGSSGPLCNKPKVERRTRTTPYGLRSARRFTADISESIWMKPISCVPCWSPQHISVRTTICPPLCGALAGRIVGESAKGKTRGADERVLRHRELEVLRLLAAGRSYREVLQRLYLSLNTVQFQVKNIHGKLAVKRRVEAIEKAREMNLI